MLVVDQLGLAPRLLLQSHDPSPRHKAAKTRTLIPSRSAHPPSYSSSSLRSLAAPLMTLMLSCNGKAHRCQH